MSASLPYCVHMNNLHFCHSESFCQINYPQLYNVSNKLFELLHLFLTVWPQNLIIIYLSPDLQMKWPLKRRWSDCKDYSGISASTKLHYYPTWRNPASSSQILILPSSSSTHWYIAVENLFATKQKNTHNAEITLLQKAISIIKLFKYLYLYVYIYL